MKLCLQEKACPKAITSASKYFWLKFFLLSGNDDPENDTVPVKPAAAKPAPAKGFFANKATAAETPVVKPSVPVKTTNAVKPTFVNKTKPVMKTEEQVQVQEEAEVPQTQDDPGF